MEHSRRDQPSAASWRLLVSCLSFQVGGSGSRQLLVNALQVAARSKDGRENPRVCDFGRGGPIGSRCSGSPRGQLPTDLDRVSLCARVRACVRHAQGAVSRGCRRRRRGCPVLRLRVSPGAAGSATSNGAHPRSRMLSLCVQSGQSSLHPALGPGRLRAKHEPSDWVRGSLEVWIVGWAQDSRRRTLDCRACASLRAFGRSHKTIDARQPLALGSAQIW